MTGYPERLLPLIRDVGAELQCLLSEYFNDGNVPLSRLDRADLVLALLRINTPKALECAAKVLGRPITICPPAVPPWPPLPVARQRTPKVSKVGQNPYEPGGDPWCRFNKVKVGSSRRELLNRGVTKRDLSIWLKSGAVEFGA